MIKRLLRALLAAAIVTTALIAPLPSAHADTSTDLAAMTATWTQYGVPAKTQRALIAKYQAGKLWDSMTSAAPVKSKKTVSGTDQVVVNTFADGSITIITVSSAPDPSSGTGGVTPQASISSCSYSGGSYWYSYTGCKTEANWVIYGLSFRFSYSGSYSTSSITNYYGASSWVIAPGGSVSNKYYYAPSSTQIWMFADVNWALGSATACMGARVSGPSAYGVENC